MAAKLKPLYSGPNSKAVWDRIRATHNLVLYLMGCALQDVETRFIQALVEAERQQRALRTTASTTEVDLGT